MKPNLHTLQKLTALESIGADPNLDLIAEIERSQYTEITDRIKAGTLVNPLPSASAVPYGWRKVRQEELTHAYLGQLGATKGLLVLASICLYQDLAWYHVSCSRDAKIPSYLDLAEVKRIWFGADRWAIQVFPVTAKHVNIHPHCLHLWHCLDDGFQVPDFATLGHI
jgi:hypothetical protein